MPATRSGSTRFQDLWQQYLEATDKKVVELQAEQWRLLEYESSAQDAPKSDYKEAGIAAGRLREVARRLRDAKADLLALERERETYWIGPASTLFSKTMHALRVYVIELATTYERYAELTEGKVGNPHHAAHSELYLADGAFTKDWNETKKRDGTAVTLAAQRADATINDRMSGEANQTTFNNRWRNFSDLFTGGVLPRATERYTAVFSKLRDEYGQARSGYVPLPVPDFTNVVVKGQSGGDDEPPGDKPPPFDPSSLGGGGPDLSDLGGGDLPDLSSLGGGDGGPDLGRLGGSGSSDLGSLGGGGNPQISGFPPGSFAPGPGGTSGYDVTGNGRPDLSPNGARLPGSDLPAGARTVRRPDGSYGIDLNGDGKADVDLSGKALPGGDTPAGARLVTGPDGTTGYDITGNDTPDLGLDLRPLSNGDLPTGSSLIISGGEVTGIDLNGDGVADVTLGGRGLPGAGAGNGGQLVTGADGITGFDLNGDGQPEIGLDGKPLRTQQPTPDPGGVVPGDQVRRTTDAPSSSGTGQLITQGPGGGMGYPPPILPPMGGMGGQQNNERERQTWLQEEDEVWAEDVMPVAALGRPGDDDEETDEPVDEWAVPARRTRGVPRPAQPGQGAWSPDWARR